VSRPPGVLLPILQEADWSGQTLAVVRPLVPFEAPRVPWVSFAYADSQRRYTVTPSALEEEGRSKEALEWEALAQLSRRATEWEVRARRADGWPLALTVVDEFASAFVLDAGRLREGHKRLAAERAWVAIPTQGVLVMRAREADDAEALLGARELEAWARDAFSRALDTRVTPTVFAVEAGVLVAASSLRPRGRPPSPRCWCLRRMTRRSAAWASSTRPAHARCRWPTWRSPWRSSGAAAWRRAAGGRGVHRVRR
jgi:hypothetical protein